MYAGTTQISQLLTGHSFGLCRMRHLPYEQAQYVVDGSGECAFVTNLRLRFARIANLLQRCAARDSTNTPTALPTAPNSASASCYGVSATTCATSARCSWASSRATATARYAP